MESAQQVIQPFPLKAGKREVTEGSYGKGARGKSMKNSMLKKTGK